MKTVRVLPAPGGWIVECDLGDMPLAFLSVEDAHAKAQELGGLYADRGQLAQVIVEDRYGVVVASTVIAPGLPRPSPDRGGSAL
jgi:hypothetical protein